MTARGAFVLDALRSQLARVPLLTAVGLIGVGLGGLLLLAAFVGGAEVAPEGNLVETAIFDGSVGLFVLTMALLAPEVEWKSLERWARWVAGLTLFAYTVETVQAVRGIDPRFTEAGGTADQVLGLVFLVQALALMGFFIGLAVKFFRAPDTAFTLAVRYGAIASLVAFGVGIWMSLVTQGRTVEPDGNLLTLHGAGFHGVQFVPMIALLLRWAAVPDTTARSSIHLAGTTWLVLCLAVAWQSGSGGALSEPTAATTMAVVGLVLFAIVGVRALHTFWSATVTDRAAS